MQELTYSNINNAIVEGEPTVIEFYKPSCVHCQKVAKDLEELKKKYKNVNFYQVNAIEEKALSEDYEIMSAPTLVFFTKGKMKDKRVGETHHLIIDDILSKLN